jgi:hypothetical protein
MTQPVTPAVGLVLSRPVRLVHIFEARPIAIETRLLKTANDQVLATTGTWLSCPALKCTPCHPDVLICIPGREDAIDDTVNGGTLLHGGADVAY